MVPVPVFIGPEQSLKTYVKECQMKEFMFYRLLAFAGAGMLDQLLGDPRVPWHPICLIGNMIRWTEHWTRPLFPRSKHGERAAGVYLVLFVLIAAVAVPVVILMACYRLHWLLGVLAESILLFFTFSAKSLERESMAVYSALEQEGLEASRYAVSMIVGRDTKDLSEEGVVKAAVETVAENTSDGVIAPLFYAVIGGAPLAYFYKAVNTMDSMVGYKNDKYRYYGTAAAKLDDLINLIPARLSAFLLLAAFGTVKRSAGWEDSKELSLREVWKIYRRDRHAHASPNSAQTESVMAGALGVQLAGDASYFGVIHRKPTIGDAKRPVVRKDIVRAVCLMKRTAVTGWGLGCLLLLSGVFFFA